MNLWLRFFRVLIQALFSKKIALLDESCLSFRVMPWDCDFNFHLTNSRYSSFMDLGRVYYMSQVGIFKKLLKRKWFPVIHSAEYAFIRPVAPFRKINMITRIIYWDDKYFYMEQRFECRGQLCALCLVRGLFIHDKEKIQSQRVLALTGAMPEKPDKLAMVEHWQHLIAEKRKAYAQRHE